MPDRPPDRNRERHDLDLYEPPDEDLPSSGASISVIAILAIVGLVLASCVASLPEIRP